MRPISFRPVQPGDGALLHELHGDPSTNVHNPYGASPDRDASEEMLSGWLRHWSDYGFGYELAFDDVNLVGICGARHDRWQDRPVRNLYWRLMPEYWHRGLAGVLGRRALEIAESASQPHDVIVARMLPSNAGSIRVAEALGLERRQDLDDQVDGTEWILYAKRAGVSGG
ncbi:MAG: GNAT family N-acetyltransferase [Pseudolysinimonas sp.]